MMDNAQFEPYDKGCGRSESEGDCPMAPVQAKILDVLFRGEPSMNDLVSQVREDSGDSASTVKAAVLPLISSDYIEMTADRKLRLHTR
jgi:hypothetical protein